MRKIATIMAREYKAMVGTKAFLISILMMPVLMFGSLAAMAFLPRFGELRERKIIVFEGQHNAELVNQLMESAKARNALLQSSSGAEKKGGLGDANAGELFVLERHTDQPNDERRFALSEEIREQKLYAFVELPDDLLNAKQSAVARFFSQDASLSEARVWMANELSRLLREMRLQQLFDGNQIAQINQAEIPLQFSGRGLFETDGTGTIKAAEEKHQFVDILLPLAFMMLMFMVIFMAAQPMLEAVLEEKSQRIAEVLLGSVSPTQLMVGKLLGTVSGSLTIFLLYMVGSYFVAQQRGWTEHVPLHLLPWFIVFQVLGVLFFASIFMAVGASVSQLKEAQSLLLPVWMVMMLPLFVWLLIIRDPLGPLARWFSFFPPSTSTTMILRLATNQKIPVWELVTSLVILVVATIAVIVLAGRIFRIGILWQGKMPKLGELIRWALSG